MKIVNLENLSLKHRQLNDNYWYQYQYCTSPYYFKGVTCLLYIQYIGISTDTGRYYVLARVHNIRERELSLYYELLVLGIGSIRKQRYW